MWVAAFAGVALAVLRERPTVDIDPGIFISIFGALGDGHRLYVDILDNKDPLFFYTGAIVSSIFGARGLFLLDAALIVCAAVLAALIARERRLGPVATAATGIIAAGLMTHPLTYISGMTQLLAMVLLLGAVYAGLRGAMAVGGALAAAAVLSKLPMLVFVPALLAFALALRGPTRTLRSVWSFLGVTALVLAVMAVRGELVSYWEAISVNLGYTGRALEVFGSSPAPRGTLSFVWRQFTEPALLLPALWTAGAGLLATRVLARRWRASGPVAAAQAYPTAVLTLGALISLAIYVSASAFFAHHLQVFALAAIPASVFLFEEAPTSWLSRSVLPVVLAMIALWGLPADLTRIDDVAARWEPLESDVAALVEASIGPLTTDDPVPYAVAGETAEEAIVWFLDAPYAFSCRFILQQPWFHGDHFDEHLSCIEREPTVVVSMEPSPVYVAGSSSYADYWRRLDALLSGRFTLVGEGENDRGYVRVWVRDPP